MTETTPQLTMQEIENPDILTLSNGETLRLKAAGRVPLQRMIVKLGGPKFLQDPSLLKSLPIEEQMIASRISDQLLTYCAGWGVVDDPPEGSIELLEVLGLSADSDNPHLYRANWVLNIKIEDPRDLAKLLSQVLLLTFGTQGALPREEPPIEMSEKEREIAELKARLAELEG